MTNADISVLQERWVKLFGDNAPAKAVPETFDRLAIHYDEPGRHYHTLAHVAHCLQTFDQVAETVEDPLSLELAIWFHDVVYDPKGSDNERRSAVLAEEVLHELNASEATIATVRDLIMVTRHPSEPQTDDEAVMVDVDLAILGAGHDDYDRYEKAIRKEYAHVPEKLFNEKRGELLQSFLEMPHIYRTTYFQDQLEAQARANLGRAIDELKTTASET